MKTKMYITLNSVKFYAHHGVLPQETIVGNTFIVDLKLKVDFSQAAKTDDLKYTINYAEVYNIIKEEMEIPSKLLEHVCQRMIQRLCLEFPQIEEIKIQLSKQKPPITGADMESAGVVTKWKK